MMPISSYGAKAASGNSKYPPLMNAGSITKPVTYTIASAEARDMKGEKKIILGFKERPEQMVVNKTNIGALAELFGDVEPKDLVGKTVTIARVPTTYEGKATFGLRVVG